MTLSQRKLAEQKRKIARGLRKQAEQVQYEKEEIWRRLQDTGLPPRPNFEVKFGKINSKSHKFKKNRTLKNDPIVQFNRDVERELAKEIQNEIDNEIIRQVKFTSEIDEEIEKQIMVQPLRTFFPNSDK